MNWADIKGDIAKAAPLLGTLVGGPAGGTVGAMIASVLGTANQPDAVQQALATDPEAAVKLREIESNQIVQLQQLAVQQAQNDLAAETQRIQDVNNTMQAEDKSDHWPTYSWRPFIGFVFGSNLAVMSLIAILTYVAQLCGAPGASSAVASLPQLVGVLGAANGAALPILGVASYFRGKMQADQNVQTDNRG
jgi:uncharacterized coiled-coil protein SlyX